MTDTTEAEKAVKPLHKQINATLKDYFDVRRDRAKLKLKFEKQQSKLAAQFQTEDEPLQTLETELKIKLRALVIPNEALLFTGKLRSFATNFGRVSFKKKAESTKIADVAGFESAARKDRALNALGSFTRVWKPSKIKEIQAWMVKNPVRAKKYERFMETNGGFDEMFVKPNDPYLAEHDPNQLTANAVNLGPVVSQDESPDA